MEKTRFITIINDCFDENVKARLGTRVSSLFGISPTIIGVGGNLVSNNSHDPAEYQAAGCLIDTLDAANGEKGIILVNVANRHGKGKKWPNGTPFGYFYINDTLVISTIDGITLSLVKKLRLINSIQLLDIPEVANKMAEDKIISVVLAMQIINTQFRSFEFQPRVAKWLVDGITVPAASYTLSHVPQVKSAIWYVDNFGNCKTTILPKEIEFENGKDINTNLGVFKCFTRLRDVPNGNKALILGSSGYKNKRFIELVIQGKSAAKEFGLTPSSQVIFT